MNTLPNNEVIDHQDRLAREQEHFNCLAQDAARRAVLKMPLENIRRYDRPPADTPYALEYAFHLLGEIRGQTVLALGCGDGLDTVILGALGASVIAVDISDESLRLAAERARANGVENRIRFVHSDAANLKSIENNSIDKAHCAAILHHVGIAATTRELYRVLKPGGVAVFLEPLLGPAIWQWTKKMLPDAPGVSDDEKPLDAHDIEIVNQSIGAMGRQRKFGLSFRLVACLGIKSKSLMDVVSKLDYRLIRTSRLLSSLASPMVWEAIKPN